MTILWKLPRGLRKARLDVLAILFALITLYTTLEDLLVEYSGETRVGNLFCLRTKDAEHIVEMARRSLQTATFMGDFRDEHLRYAAMNLTAITKYGSLEFRSFRGTTNAAEIHTWVRMLLALKDRAIEWDDPRRVIEQFSLHGPERFLTSVFQVPELYTPLMGMRNLDSRLYEGMRLAQSIAFATDWDAKPKAKSAKDAVDKYRELLRQAEPRPDAWINDGVHANVPPIPAPPPAEALRFYDRYGHRLDVRRPNATAITELLRRGDTVGLEPCPVNDEEVARNERAGLVWDAFQGEWFGMSVTTRGQQVPGPWWHWTGERWTSDYPLPEGYEWADNEDEAPAGGDLDD